jgi:phospholipid transport system transporter-binding protein
MMALSLTVKSDEWVILSGDLTFATINKKATQLIDFKKINHELVIDLAGIKKSDSAGLALLIEWLKISQKSLAQLRFKNIPTQLITLAKLSGFELEPYIVSEN